MKIFYYGERSVETERFSFAIAEDIECFNSLSLLWQEISNQGLGAIILVGSDISLTDALSLAEKCRNDFPFTKVMLSRQRLDVEVLARAIRAGVAEVVSSDDPTAFAEGVKRVRDLIQVGVRNSTSGGRESRKARVILVFSAKGGCGKTTISINLATTLSQKWKVCLMDLDLQFGDIAVSMQKEPEKTISSAIAMGSDIDRLGARSMLTTYSDKLDLLLAPNNPTDVEFINGRIVGSVVEELQSDYDFIVIDTPPAFTDFVLKATEMMDVCFLITTLDMPALKNMRVVLDTMKALKLDMSLVKIVINRADSKTGISAKEAENLIERNVEFQIPNEINVSVATNRGMPTCLSVPKSEFSKEFNRMASSLEEWFGMSGTKETPKKSFYRKKSK